MEDGLGSRLLTKVIRAERNSKRDDQFSDMNRRQGQGEFFKRIPPVEFKNIQRYNFIYQMRKSGAGHERKNSCSG